jgi:hypothetical protein
VAGVSGTVKKTRPRVRRTKLPSAALVRIPRFLAQTGSLYITLGKSRGIDTSSCLAYKKRRTDSPRQITRGAGRAPGAAAELKLSGQVRPMSRSRAFVRHDICFLLRRTYAPRRIYMSHRNRSAVGTASSYGIGTGFRGRGEGPAASRQLRRAL